MKAKENLGLIDLLVYRTNDLLCNCEKIFGKVRGRWMEIGHSSGMKRRTILFFTPHACLTTRSSHEEKKRGCATINYSNQVNNVFIYVNDLPSPFIPPSIINFFIDSWINPIGSSWYSVVFIEPHAFILTGVESSFLMFFPPSAKLFEGLVVRPIYFLEARKFICHFAF